MIDKTKEQLIKELLEIQLKFDALKDSNDKTIKELFKATKWGETLLSSLPHPAMFIRSKDRVVIAANKVAFEMGVKIGGYCWREFMKEEYLSPQDKEIAAKFPDAVPPDYNIKCTFCLSDKCFLDSPEQIDHEVFAFGLIWETYWIKLSEEVYLHYAINNTDKKKVEKELLESELKYRELVDNSPDAIVIYQNDKIVFANNECLRLAGAQSIENLLGKSLLEFVHADSLAFVIERMRKIANNETVLPFSQEKFVRLDGSEIEVEVKAIPIRFEQKQAVQLIISDITDRKKAEEKLHLQSEIMSNMSEAIYMIRMADGIIVYVNSVFEKMFGYEHNEMLGKHVSIVNAPTEKSPQQIAMEIMEYINEHGFWKGEVENIRKDGTVFTCNVSVTLFEHSKFGKAIIAIHTDITASKLAEMAHKESEKKYRFIIENVGEGIGFVNEVGEFIVANPTAEKIFGVGKGGLLGRNLKDFLSEEQYLVILNQTKIRTKGQESVYEFELTRPDRKKRDVYIIAVPQFDDNNKFIGTNGIFRDITEQKQVELALLESEAKIKNMVKDMQVGVLLQGPDTEILVSNPKALELLGLTENQLLGKTSFDPDWNVIHEDGSPFPGHTLPVPQAIATHESVHDVIMGVYRPSKNDRVWLKVDAELQVYNDDTIKQVVCSFIDITELKKAEQELKNSEQKLLKLNLDKNRFISIIGHDLRNSFSNLLGLSEALIEDICIKNYDETGDIANLIIETTQNASKLLDEILLWARTQQGKIPFKPQKLNFTNVCNNVLEVLRPIAFTKNITIHYSATNQLYVFADLDMLKTVLRNLISNAIKFTNKEGVITISALESPEFVTITISDNGIGISSDVVGKLFDISEVIASKGTAGESGTGLGLLLCKDFIEKHAGNIWVESKIGKGSDFKFTLPVPLEDANDIYN